MKELNPDQKYFAEEFYDDYREGLISRRIFIKRLAYITVSSIYRAIGSWLRHIEVKPFKIGRRGGVVAIQNW